MKAFDIMMYMIIFNLVVIVFGTLGLFGQMALEASYFARVTAYAMIGTAVGALATAAVIGYVTKSAKTSATHWAYGAFGVTFWASYLSAIAVVDSLRTQVAGFGASMLWVYGIFTVVVAYLFITGLIQMTTGGWKSYK